MNKCYRLLTAAFLVSGLVGSAIAQPSEADRGFGGRSERGFPGARGEEGEEPRGPGGRFGGGPQPSPMFTAVDADGDGVITNRELRKAAAALKTLDADGDGNITQEEASPARGSGRGGPGGRRGPGGLGDPNAMIDRIMEGDKNGDGQLSPDEVPPQMGRMLSDADLNGDRVIDQQELRQAVENLQNRFGGRGGPGGGGRGRAGQGGFRGGNPESMMQQLMASDTDGDGLLSPKEVPRQLMPMLQGADLNGDGFLNNREVQQAAAKMQNRGGDRGRGRDQGFGGERGRSNRPGSE